MNTKKFFSRNRVKQAAAAFFAAGALLWGGNVSAAAADDGMWAFREAYLAAPQDNRAFLQGLNFLGPAFHADVDGSGQIMRDGSLRMEGKIDWVYTDLKANTTQHDVIPFYIEQANGEMNFYSNRGGTWSKLPLPGIPIGLANALKTSDVNILTENMSAVKQVELQKDTANQRMMRIVLDGNRLAELIRKDSSDNVASLNADEQKSQREFLHRLEKALTTTDVVVNWTVDKSTWQTVTASINLTDLMRAYAKGVLQEAADGSIVLDDRERAFMDALGYYSELQSYTTYLKPDDAKTISLPADAKNAAVNENVFQDLRTEAASSAAR